MLDEHIDSYKYLNQLYDPLQSSGKYNFLSRVMHYNSPITESIELSNSPSIVISPLCIDRPAIIET